MTESAEQLTGQNGVLIPQREAQRNAAIEKIINDFLLNQDAQSVEEKMWDMLIICMGSKEFNRLTAQEKSHSGCIVRELITFLRSLQCLVGEAKIMPTNPDDTETERK